VDYSKRIQGDGTPSYPSMLLNSFNKKYLKVMKMIRIKLLDGIPCIILDDGIIWTDEEIKNESKRLIMPEYFTKIQESKEKSYYDKVLDEIKKKFGEK